MPIQTVSKFEVRLRSARTFADAMRFRRYSVRSLAEAATRELVKQKHNGVSKSTIGNLASGARKGTRPEVASVLEDLLDCAPGSLFETRVSNVQRETGHTQRGSADLGVVMTLMFAMGIVAATLYGLSWLIAQAPSLSEVGGWIGGVL